MDTITINLDEPMNRKQRRFVERIKRKGTVISVEERTMKAETPVAEATTEIPVNDHRAESLPIVETPEPAQTVTLTPEQLAEAKRLLEAEQVPVEKAPVAKAALHAVGSGAKAITKTPGLLLKGIGFVGGVTVRGAKAIGGAVADGYKKAGA